MHGNKTLIVVAVVAGIVVIAIIAYYLARFMRGSIKLTLPRTAFNPGDVITGSFDLHAKKAIEGNKLVVRLIGTEITESREDGKTETNSREIYRSEVLIEPARSYPAGHMANYPFEIAAPTTPSMPDLPNNAVGQALKSVVGVIEAISDKSAQLKWKIEVRLDAKGIDLVTTQAVSININQLI